MITTLVVFFFIGGVIWWATSSAGGNQDLIKANEPRAEYKAGAYGMGPRIRYPIVSPRYDIPSDIPIYDHGTSKARVTVTEVRPGNPSRPAASSAAARQQPRTNPVRDMFPVGRIIQGTPDQSHQPQEAKPAELFPSFSYAGRLWAYTGNMATSQQVDMVATGFSVGNRQVYKLSSDDGTSSVVFVQSSQDADRFAIYRGDNTQG